MERKWKLLAIFGIVVAICNAIFTTLTTLGDCTFIDAKLSYTPREAKEILLDPCSSSIYLLLCRIHDIYYPFLLYTLIRILLRCFEAPKVVSILAGMPCLAFDIAENILLSTLQFVLLPQLQHQQQQPNSFNIDSKQFSKASEALLNIAPWISFFKLAFFFASLALIAIYMVKFFVNKAMKSKQKET